MNLIELKNSIINNQVDFLIGNILIFTGEESYLQNLYIRKFGEVLKVKPIYADDYIEIKRKLTSNTMVDNKGLFIIRNSKALMDIEVLEKIRPARDKYLILIYDKLDKRKPLYKEWKDKICEFEKMTDSQLTNIIKKKLDLSDENCKLFIDTIDKDYGCLLLEIDKLSILKQNLNKNDLKQVITDDEVFIKAINDGLIYRELTDVSFLFNDEVLNKHKSKALVLLKEIKEMNIDAFKIMGLLYSNLKNMLLLSKSDNINLAPFQKAKLKGFLRLYEPIEIIDKLELIQEVEQGIKSGKIDQEIALDYLTIQLLYK